MFTVEVFHILKKKNKKTKNKRKRTTTKEKTEAKKQKQEKYKFSFTFTQQSSNLSRRSHTSTLPSVLVIKNTPEKKIR